jgi:hypothetical protein
LTSTTANSEEGSSLSKDVADRRLKAPREKVRAGPLTF